MSASAGFQLYYHLDKSVQLQNKTLVAPVVSVANVAQLSVDILIATLDLKRIGIFDPRYLHPIVGAREDSEAGVITPLELYGRDGLDLVFIQQRSPAIKATKSLFVASLFKFIKDHKLATLLFVSGVDPSNRTDAQMNDPIFRFVPPKSPSISSTPLAKVEQLPEYSYASSELVQLAHSPNARPSVPFIPGGGLTRRLLLSLPSGWSIPTAAVMQFVFEGDNRADALFLAETIANLLPVNPDVTAWKQPKSWALGLFGTPLDQSLYG